MKFSLITVSSVTIHKIYTSSDYKSNGENDTLNMIYIFVPVTILTVCFNYFPMNFSITKVGTQNYEWVYV